MPETPTNLLTAIGFKLTSALLFATMSALVRQLGDVAPVGQMVFFRSAFAIPPVLLIYALRGEFMSAIRTRRPFGQLGRGALSTFGMFTNFSALTRLPLAEATAINFASPLITVALAALILKERVRIFRWSAVAVGFFGVIVTRRLTQSEPTASIVFYFSLITTLAGAVTLPFAWHSPTAMELTELIATGVLGGIAHIFLTESYRHATASVIAPFDYTAMLWALLLGYWLFGELPGVLVYVGAAIVAAAGLAVIFRERWLGLQRAREAEGLRRPEI